MGCSFRCSQILNKPTIPAAQVNSDWDAASGVAQILNKPTLATVATSGEAEDVSYDNTVSGMTATDVQAAVDELKSNLSDLPYYQDGETYSITQTVYIIGMSGSNGKSYTATLFLPKKIPNDYTITYSASMNNIRCGNTTLSSGLSVSGMSIRGDNTIIFTAESTTATSANSLCNIVPNSITITFHAPT